MVHINAETLEVSQLMQQHGSQSNIRTMLGRLFYIPAYKGDMDIEIMEEED